MKKHEFTSLLLVYCIQNIMLRYRLDITGGFFPVLYFANQIRNLLVIIFKKVYLVYTATLGL